MAGRSGSIRVSLFDNDDPAASLGFISHLTVVPGPGTALALESSAVVTGPYAVEGAAIRHARRRITSPRPGAHRFFQLDAAAATRITSFGEDGGDWLFHYTGGAAGIAPRLLSSAQSGGPYAPEGGIVADPLNRTLRKPGNGAMRYFRLKSEIPLSIRSLSFENDVLVIRYE